MSVKVYGKSDAETQLIEKLNGRFKIIQINSLKDYTNFTNYPYKCKEEWVASIEKKIIDARVQIKDTDQQIYEQNQRLNNINSQIGRKINTKSRQYGKLARSTQDDIDDLKSEKNNVRNTLENLNNELNEHRQNINKLNEQKKVDGGSFDSDIKLNQILKSNPEILNLCKGAGGEIGVIEYIKEKFENENNFYLINSFDIDLIGKGLIFKDKLRFENKIDHVFISPRGVMILETKSWKEYSPSGIQNIIDQLQKTKVVFHTFFQDKIPIEKIEIILVSTTSHVNLSKEQSFLSMQLDKLYEHVVSSKNILSPDDISLIMRVLLPYLGTDHVTLLDRVNIHAKGVMVDAKKVMQSLFK